MYRWIPRLMQVRLLDPYARLKRAGRLPALRQPNAVGRGHNRATGGHLFTYLIISQCLVAVVNSHYPLTRHDVTDWRTDGRTDGQTDWSTANRKSGAENVTAVRLPSAAVAWSLGRTLCSNAAIFCRLRRVSSLWGVIYNLRYYCRRNLMTYFGTAGQSKRKELL